MLVERGPSLADWPTELRLYLYAHMIRICLCDGNAADIFNLACCCRTIHCEIYSEFMPTVRPLFLAQHQWRTCSNSQHGALAVALDTPANFPPERTKLHVIVPGQDIDGALEDDSCIAKVLEPICMGPRWAELSLSTKGRADTSYVIEQHAVAGRQLVKILPRTLFSKPRIQRFVFNFQSEQDPASMMNWVAMLSVIARRDLQDFRETMKRAWISRARGALRPGWRVTVDFRDDLEAAEGALWMLEHSSTGLRTTRLFGPDLKEASDWIADEQEVTNQFVNGTWDV